MGTVAIKIKVMPDGLETNLKELGEKIKEGIEKEKGVVVKFDEEEIAFGLKALIVTFAWPEEKDTELAEKICRSVAGVSQVDIIDYRRAMG